MKSEPASLVAPLRQGGVKAAGSQGTSTPKARPVASVPPDANRQTISTGSPNIQILTRPTPPAPTVAPMPRWPFFAADAALLGTVVVLLAVSPRPWSPTLLFVAVLLVLLGGVVAVLPFLMAPRSVQRGVDAPQPHPKLRITLH